MKIFLFILALANAFPSSSEAQTVKGRWISASGQVKSERVSLIAGKSVVFTRLVPETAYRTISDLKDKNGKIIIPVGSDLIKVDILWGKNKGVNAACEIQRQKGRESNYCAVDQDGDGRFEGMMKLFAAFSDLFFLSYGNPSIKLAYSPIDLEMVSDRDSVKSANFEFVFSSYASLLDKRIFKFCIASEITNIFNGNKIFNACLSRSSFGHDSYDLADADYPKLIQFMDGSVTVSRATDTGVEVLVRRPGPGQLFLQ